jgi:hypothetical protein
MNVSCHALVWLARSLLLIAPQRVSLHLLSQGEVGLRTRSLLTAPHASPVPVSPEKTWYALQQAGLHVPVNGYGRLFTKSND